MAIFCEKCGFQNTNSAKFCKGCGGEVIATTSKGTLLAGVMLENRYEIQRLVKSGGMGAVYEALDHKFKKIPCAVKEMLNLADESDHQQYFIDRFKEEAQILHTLRHPNLPVVKDYFITSGRYYLVMEYIDGKDLDTVMRSYGVEGVPPALVIDWAKELLDVLDYLHNQNPPIVYRDLKPANIMLRSSDNRLMLIDFGIARTMTPGSDSTKTGIGTPVFAPKEILLGKPEIRSDIYSLGATMHCLLTGLVPVMPGDFAPVRSHKPDVPQELDDIVMCALSMNPDGRYKSASHMKEALENMKNISVTVNTPTVPYNSTVPYSSVPVPPSVTPSQERSLYKTDVASSGISSKEALPRQSPVPTGMVYHTPTVPVKTASQKKDEKDNKKFLIPAIIALLIVCIAGGVMAHSYFNNPVNLKKWAEDAYRNSEYKTAKKNYDKLLNIEKDIKKKCNILLSLGDIALKMEDPNSAAVYYSQAVAIDGKNEKALLALDDLYRNKKDYTSLKDVLDKFAEAGKFKKDDYLELGKIFTGKEDYKNASACFLKVLSKDSDNMESLRSLVKCYTAQGEYEKVIDTAKKILAIYKSDKSAIIASGAAYYKLKDYTNAVTYLEKGLKLNPSGEEKKNILSMSFTCYVKLGQSYSGKNKYDEAEKNFKKAMDIDNTDKDVKTGLSTCYMNKGKRLYESGKYEEARYYFDNIATVNPGGGMQKDAVDYITKIDEKIRAASASTWSGTDNSTGWSGGGGGGSSDDSSSSPPPVSQPPAGGGSGGDMVSE